MIYLASPYTALSSQWPQSAEEIRFLQNLHVVSILTSRGHFVCSPIILGHTIDRAMKNSGLPSPSYEWWVKWSQELLEGCDTIYVLCLEGWQESRGVRSEIRWAKENDLPIVYINSEGFQISPEEE